LSNFIQPELMRATPDDKIHAFDYILINSQMTKLELAPNWRAIKGKRTSFCQFENECAQKMCRNSLSSNLAMLNPQQSP